MADKITLPASVVKAIGDQQTQLFRAQGIVQCVKEALENHFGNWPAGLPQFNTALEAADSMLDKIGCGLFDSTLEDAAQKIEAEWEEEERRKAEEVENG